MTLHIENVSKIYNNGTHSILALQPISLCVQPGEFICLLGPSGCGKSTLLRLIADQISLSSGNITINNLTPTSARQQKGIAWMAQNPALLPWKTVRENIELSNIINPRFNHPTLTFHDYLQLVDLIGFEDAYPETLSGGMQQRAALARTLAIGASLWLMDEPFAALDEFTRELLAIQVLKLWAMLKPTVIWVTHSIMEAVMLADRIIVMSQRPGSLKADVAVNLPRPRDMMESDCLSIVRKLREYLKP